MKAIRKNQQNKYDEFIAETLQNWENTIKLAKSLLRERDEARAVATKYYKEVKWHRRIQVENRNNLKLIVENTSE